MEKEIRKAKTFNYTALAVVCLLILAIVGLVVFEVTKPLCDSVTIPYLEAEVSEANDRILTKTGEEYYEISASADLGNTFSFGDWVLTSVKPQGDPQIAICFAELYVMEIYDGYAAVYDGYSPLKTVPYAYYTIPEDVADSLIAYFRDNGIPHTYGDGTISSATFNH